jgi:hypothetical protein
LGVLKPFQFFFRIAGYAVKSGLPASFHYAVFLRVGRTQTLSGFTKLRFVVPSELGVPKPFQFFFRIAGYAVFLNFYEGRTQTLSTKCCAFRWVF